MSKFGGGIGAPSKEERLKEAADIHLRLGQIQRYCELMVELGQVTVGVFSMFLSHVLAPPQPFLETWRRNTLWVCRVSSGRTGCRCGHRCVTFSA